jgi:hypothetical protein
VFFEKDYNNLVYLTLHSIVIVLDSYETRHVTGREENRVTEFDSRVLENIFGSRREEATECLTECTMISFMTRTIRHDQIQRIKWAGHVARIGGKEMHTGFWQGKQTERDHTQDLGIDWRVLLKLIARTRMG